ncbi:hypothetical protein BDZ91DRAFT_783594 [Kalaharituber pfeilii]|nr:hypothetical protein BDZ91DRAFT_783594 [Kalaharituber pfeilii]
MPPNTEPNAPPGPSKQDAIKITPYGGEAMNYPTRGAAPRDTGFKEPLSRLSNTTLPHKDAVVSPGGELNVSLTTEKKRQRHPTFGRGEQRSADNVDPEENMYKDLELVDAEDFAKAQRKGKVKRVFQKLHCVH